MSLRAAGAAVLLAALALQGAPGKERPPESRPPRKPNRPAPNRLASEKSPYLLQHARNPVDWFPWGEEAFRKARVEGKPVFLSIGYSTCHWCHVMEKESFENEEIARILNEAFVSIKVDREERPDIDDVYMSAVQLLSSGRGGWPLSVFLTPEGKPFFGGTYFPPEDDPGRGRGFKTLLLLIQKTWAERRADIDQSAEELVKAVKRAHDSPGSPDIVAAATSLSREGLQAGFIAYRRDHDPLHGGFGNAPKFPRTSVLDFLMAHAAAGGPGEARAMAIATLDHMARGGIRDHLAGGFHRYSTDREWTVPHFEKMLYDQALIARAYIDAGRFTGEARHLLVGREILDWVLAHLASPEGGFHSAWDADSEGEEGTYYVWSRAEVVSLLGPEDGELLADYHGITGPGNFEKSGKSVLTARVPIEDLAKRSGKDPAALSGRLSAGRRRLLEAREKRPPPARDDKVLTDWNGLFISALAAGYQATGEARYLAAAERAADFIGNRLARGGRLRHRWRDGEAAIPGFLEDHAFLAAGLLDLYEAGFDLARLREALRLSREMVRLFWEEPGGFFQTGPEHESLILRRREFYDGALPSGNSVAYLLLQRLWELTGDPELEAKVKSMDRIAARLFEEAPGQHPWLLRGAAFRLGSPRQIVVVGPEGDPLALAMVEEAHRRYLPARVLVRVTPEALARAAELIPLLRGKEAIEGRATAYVCIGGTCKLPARDLETFRKQLGEK